PPEVDGGPTVHEACAGEGRSTREEPTAMCGVPDAELPAQDVRKPEGPSGVHPRWRMTRPHPSSRRRDVHRAGVDLRTFLVSLAVGTFLFLLARLIGEPS